MSDEIDKIIRKRKSDIQNYQQLIEGCLALKKCLEEDFGYSYYFGGKITPKGVQNKKTPDIIALGEIPIIGDAKKSLKAPDGSANYIEQYIKGDLLNQMLEYDKEYVEIANQDLILFVPKMFNQAIGSLKLDFLEKNDNLFKHNFVLLSFSKVTLANTNQILLQHEFGAFSKKEMTDYFRRTKEYYDGKLSDSIGKYKIIEECENAPIEYVVLILWTCIFNEIIGSAEKDNIIKKYQMRENTFEITLDSLIDYLEKLYTVPVFNSVSNRHQFSKDIIKKAMGKLKEIGLVDDVVDDSGIIKYNITYKKLPEKNELEYILAKLNSDPSKKQKMQVRGEGEAEPIQKWIE